MNTENQIEKAQPGRPVNLNSVRQQRLLARAERLANGGSARPGRPPVLTSARQQQLAERAARLAAGEVIKRGRPKVAKQEEVTA